MKLNIKDPLSNNIFEYEAHSCKNEREAGWAVKLPAGNSIFITLQEGEWKIRHDKTVAQNLITSLGQSISLNLQQQEQI